MTFVVGVHGKDLLFHLVVTCDDIHKLFDDGGECWYVMDFQVVGRVADEAGLGLVI